MEEIWIMGVSGGDGTEWERNIQDYSMNPEDGTIQEKLFFVRYAGPSYKHVRTLCIRMNHPPHFLTHV